MTFQIGVIQFPGSNCERETKLALLRAQLNPVDIFWFDHVEKLKNCDGYVIVGGFSYEDRGRSGVIAAHDPMIKTLTVEAKKGKPILGICNGAQILVESGLVPGCVNDDDKLESVIALARNCNKGFYNAWISIKTNNIPAFKVPIAHAEGRFLLSDDLYALLKKSKVPCWYYADTNPNGSDYGLAAVGNFSKNILAMMPHPERTIDGNIVFDTMRQYLEEKNPFQWITHHSDNKYHTHTHAHTSAHAYKYFVKLAIADNEAMSVQMAFQKMGLELDIQKYRFWGLNADNSALSKIEDSFELWNPKKENITLALPAINNTQFLLVQDLDDTIAAQKTLRLKEKYGIQSLTDLTTGIVWQLTGPADIISKAMLSRLLFNPVSQHAIPLKNTAYYSGKVRELIDEGDTLLIETTNRMTAFDRYLCDVPQKGTVLTQLSAWWFEETKHIIPNHFIEMIDHNKMRVKKCKVLPIEVVVRGFLTGSTNTSILALYEKGERQFFETRLPDGLQKNSVLSTPIITPTSKSSIHDEPLTAENIYNYVSKELWGKIKVIALQLFSFGQETAKKKGFILVDTKYEFGLDENNNLLLIDECHTPDSSRFWLNNSFEHYDKEFLRLWYKKNCDPYSDAILPKAPKELIEEMTRRYVYCYENIIQKR